MLFRRTCCCIPVSLASSASMIFRLASATPRQVARRKRTSGASPSAFFKASVAVSISQASLRMTFAPSLLFLKSVPWKFLAQASDNLTLNLFSTSRSWLRNGSLAATGSQRSPRSFSAWRTTWTFVPRCFISSVFAACSSVATGLPTSSSRFRSSASPSPSPVAASPPATFTSWKLLANFINPSVFRSLPSATASLNDFRTRSSEVARAAFCRSLSPPPASPTMANALEAAVSPSRTACAFMGAAPSFASSASTSSRWVAAASVATRGWSAPLVRAGGTSFSLRLSYSRLNFRRRSTFLALAVRAAVSAHASMESHSASTRSTMAGSPATSVSQTATRASNA
mmetsp:Transcript_15975/g.41309  ORF Transcript_15975/g.41309 Transcript_15975/m.41309 type:complete len:342 (-) Transcript_15975:1213-2238(-)